MIGQASELKLELNQGGQAAQRGQTVQKRNLTISSTTCQFCAPPKPSSRQILQMVTKHTSQKYSSSNLYYYKKDIDLILDSRQSLALVNYKELAFERVFPHSSQSIPLVANFHRTRNARSEFLAQWRYHQFNVIPPTLRHQVAAREEYYSLVKKRTDRAIRRMLDEMDAEELETAQLDLAKFHGPKQAVMIVEDNKNKEILKDLEPIYHLGIMDPRSSACRFSISMSQINSSFRMPQKNEAKFYANNLVWLPNKESKPIQEDKDSKDRTDQSSTDVVYTELQHLLNPGSLSFQENKPNEVPTTSRRGIVEKSPVKYLKATTSQAKISNIHLKRFGTELSRKLQQPMKISIESLVSQDLKQTPISEYSKVRPSLGKGQVIGGPLLSRLNFTKVQNPLNTDCSHPAEELKNPRKSCSRSKSRKCRPKPKLTAEQTPMATERSHKHTFRRRKSPEGFRSQISAGLASASSQSIKDFFQQHKTHFQAKLTELSAHLLPFSTAPLSGRSLLERHHKLPKTSRDQTALNFYTSAKPKSSERQENTLHSLRNSKGFLIPTFDKSSSKSASKPNWMTPTLSTPSRNHADQDIGVRYSKRDSKSALNRKQGKNESKIDAVDWFLGSKSTSRTPHPRPYKDIQKVLVYSAQTFGLVGSSVAGNNLLRRSGSAKKHAGLWGTVEQQPKTPNSNCTKSLEKYAINRPQSPAGNRSSPLQLGSLLSPSGRSRNETKCVQNGKVKMQSKSKSMERRRSVSKNSRMSSTTKRLRSKVSKHSGTPSRTSLQPSALCSPRGGPSPLSPRPPGPNPSHLLLQPRSSPSSRLRQPNKG